MCQTDCHSSLLVAAHPCTATSTSPRSESYRTIPQHNCTLRQPLTFLDRLHLSPKGKTVFPCFRVFEVLGKATRKTTSRLICSDHFAILNGLTSSVYIKPVKGQTVSEPPRWTINKVCIYRLPGCELEVLVPGRLVVLLCSRDLKLRPIWLHHVTFARALKSQVSKFEIQIAAIVVLLLWLNQVHVCLFFLLLPLVSPS